jgi:hypothetical protein
MREEPRAGGKWEENTERIQRGSQHITSEFNPRVGGVRKD